MTENIIFTLVSLGFGALWVIAYLRKKHVSGRPQTNGAGNDLALTRAAEAAVSRKTQEQLQEELLSTHTLYGRFSSLNGYSEDYFVKLQSYLNTKNINSEYRRSTDFADLAGGNMGVIVFEFYIDRESYEDACVMIELEFLGEVTAKLHSP